MSHALKSQTVIDQGYMAVAIGYGERGLGLCAPNPSVGCVIVRNGHMVGAGTTAAGGRPHAEVVALAMAGEKAKGATAYVTLEPCSFTGKTGPCADALIKAGIARVVIGTGDPHPKVSGKGVEKLKQVNIDVTCGVLESEAIELTKGFILAQQQQRPLYSVKIASSADGKTATSSGESKWITGQAARDTGHQLRSNHDAIMVGIETVLADDPSLDCRLAGLRDQSPIPIVMDRQGRLPRDCKLVQAAGRRPLLWITEADKGDMSATVTHLKVNNIRDLKDISKLIVDQGITRVLIEGGATLQASFIAADIADSLYWFRSSQLIGCEGHSAIGPLALEHLKDAARYELKNIRQIGDDLLETRTRKG